MKYNYKIINHSIKGRSHIRNDLPCQDKTYYIDNNDIKVISLSDGAGSCKHSDRGAEIATKVCGEYISDNFNDIYDDLDSERVGKELFKKIIDQIRLDIEEKTERNEVGKESENLEEESSKEIELDIDTSEIVIQDYSSTLLFVALFGNKYISGHIGDGLISINDDEQLKILSEPENGETSNSTYFFTAKSAEKYLRFKKGTIIKDTTFILMSDGTYECVYDRQENKFTSALYKFIDWVSKEDEDNVSDAILSNMEKHFINKTSDDCSISIIHITIIKSWYDKIREYYFES